MNRLIIIGAGGHAKVVCDIAEKCGYKSISFVDDNAKGSLLNYKIVGGCDILPSLNNGSTDFIIAIGSNAVRKKISENYDINYTTLIHPSAQIGMDVLVDKGSVIMANACINSSAKIGKHCIINTASVVEHDNLICDYVHLSPRACLGGTVSIGQETHVGIGSVVRNNISICGGCTIGAGAVVVKNIEERGTYVGVPSKKLK